MEPLTIVVNCRTDKYDVYCGRPSFLGNPFKIGKDETREQVIEKFRVYFYHRLESDPVFKRKVLELKGKRIACWCKPKPCHLDIVAEYLNGLK